MLRYTLGMFALASLVLSFTGCKTCKDCCGGGCCGGACVSQQQPAGGEGMYQNMAGQPVNSQGMVQTQNTMKVQTPQPTAYPGVGGQIPVAGQVPNGYQR